MIQPSRLRSLTATSAASFEQPFEMLQACHERVERMLSLLDRIQSHVHENGPDEQARQAARDVMRYFDLAAPHHHRDEELHVFPPVLARGEADRVAIVQRLLKEHRQMETGWIRARAVLAALAEGRIDRLEPAQQAALQDFASLYAGHLAAEEQLAYPAAQALLAPADLEAMGAEMMARRGAATAPPVQPAAPPPGGGSPKPPKP